MLSWSAPTLPQLSGPTELVPETNLTTGDLPMVLTLDQQSWVASLLNFGAFTAGPLAGNFGDIFSLTIIYLVRFLNAKSWQEMDHDSTVISHLHWLALYYLCPQR